jgi:FkbM family methyltransferase
MNIAKLIGRKFGGYFRNRLLHDHGFGFVTRSQNGVFIVDPRDFVITNFLLKTGGWSYDDIGLLSNFIGPDSTVCFVGAHIGTLMIPISKRVKEVVGYEASAQNFEFLELNCKLNDVENRRLHECAVGAEKGRVKFDYNAMNSGHSRISTGGSGSRKSSDVEVVVFDEHDGNSSTTFDLIVVDVEGAECMVLEGMTKTLESCKTLFIEFSPKYLREFGRTPSDFIELIAPHYEHMYYESSGLLRAYEDHTWEAEIQRLSRERKCLQDFLFTKRKIESISLPVERGS